MRPIMVMGVTACGKSQVGQEIADQMGGIFIEGDRLHPKANIEKMSAGIPLSDVDRAPWLDRLSEEIVIRHSAKTRVVFSCSALKRAYRDRLRKTLPHLLIVYLELDVETAVKRCHVRADHFMPATLVESQFATLEPPVDEPITVEIDARPRFDQVVANAIQAIAEIDRVPI